MIIFCFVYLCFHLVFDVQYIIFTLTKTDLSTFFFCNCYVVISAHWTVNCLLNELYPYIYKHIRFRTPFRNKVISMKYYKQNYPFSFRNWIDIRRGSEMTLPLEGIHKSLMVIVSLPTFPLCCFHVGIIILYPAWTKMRITFDVRPVSKKTI